jgi:uncharacterized protein YbbC (DUF1343 family)
VQTGFATLAADRYRAVAGKKVGILANPTTVTADLDHEVDVMRASPDIDLVAVFGPEHGFRGTTQAGYAEDFYVDERTGLPVYDLYDKDVDGASEVIGQAGIEVMLFDIQDVGARFYTYIWSMYTAMRAAARLGIPFVVMDRPNPISGLRAEGPVFKPGFESGVGLAPIAQRHGLTVGELAHLCNTEFQVFAELTVIPMQGWDRGQYYEDTGLPWVPPSPNMPTVDCAVVYPGTCLFEGTNLSAGRGTTKPFETVGAPFLDYRWAEALNNSGLPGVRFRECHFIPTFNKFANETCGGVELHVTDRNSFDPTRTGVEMLITAKALAPKEFEWVAHGGRYWLDLLSGSDYVRNAIEAGESSTAIAAGWQDELQEFANVRERYLSYR